MDDITINNACGNMSGNKTLMLIPVNEIDNIEVVDMNKKILHPILLRRFFKIDVYDLKHTSEIEDDFYNNQISASIRSKENLNATLNKLSRMRFVAKVIDNNNVAWLYGTKEEPLRFEFEYISNANSDAVKEYEIKIKGDTTEPAAETEL
jgi:hypothetical protein